MSGLALALDFLCSRLGVSFLFGIVLGLATPDLWRCLFSPAPAPKPPSLPPIPLAVLDDEEIARARAEARKREGGAR